MSSSGWPADLRSHGVCRADRGQLTSLSRHIAPAPARAARRGRHQPACSAKTTRQRCQTTEPVSQSVASCQPDALTIGQSRGPPRSPRAALTATIQLALGALSTQRCTRSDARDLRRNDDRTLAAARREMDLRDYPQGMERRNHDGHIALRTMDGLSPYPAELVVPVNTQAGGVAHSCRVSSDTKRAIQYELACGQMRPPEIPAIHPVGPSKHGRERNAGARVETADRANQNGILAVTLCQSKPICRCRPNTLQGQIPAKPCWLKSAPTRYQVAAPCTWKGMCTPCGVLCHASQIRTRAGRSTHPQRCRLPIR